MLNTMHKVKLLLHLHTGPGLSTGDVRKNILYLCPQLKVLGQQHKMISSYLFARNNELLNCSSHEYGTSHANR